MSDESRIIRAERASSRAPALIRADRYAAQLTAAEIVAAARAEAEQLKAAAARERERVLELAAGELAELRARAEAEGYAAGSARAAEALLSIAGARAAALRDAERQLERAILTVARAIVGQSFEAEPLLLAHQLESHLRRLRRAQRVVVRLHPEDAEALAPRRDELRERAELEGVLELAPDPELRRGDCALESELGELDARIDTRITELARALGWEPA